MTVPQPQRFEADGRSARVYSCNTAIVGTGAAGYNAADRLWALGQHDILLVTENRVGGTSRNTGSDKQWTGTLPCARQRSPPNVL